MPELVQDIAAYGYLSVAVGSDNSIYVWGDCFGKNFATPYLTDFSTIYDAFAHSTTRVMHKPLVVSDNEDLNITESLGSGDLETFNDPVCFLLFFLFFSYYMILNQMYVMLDQYKSLWNLIKTNFYYNFFSSTIRIYKFYKKRLVNIFLHIKKISCLHNNYYKIYGVISNSNVKSEKSFKFFLG